MADKKRTKKKAVKKAEKKSNEIDGGSDEHITPPDVIVKIQNRLNVLFDLDAAANSKNKRCRRFIDKKKNALVVPWGTKQNPSTVWLNPPYSSGNVLKFALKAIKEVEIGNCKMVAVLTNADSTTKWHKLLEVGSSQIWRFRQRIKFEHPEPERMKSGAMRPQDLFVITPAGKGRSQKRYYFNLDTLVLD